MGGANGLGQWRCRQCSSIKVTDRLLAVVGQQMEVHRLSCESCRQVGHYDRNGVGTPQANLNRTFEWITSASKHAVVGK